MSEEAGGEFCRDVIRYMEDHDSTPRQGPDLIRPQEDEPADDLADLVATPHRGKTAGCSSFDGRL